MKVRDVMSAKPEYLEHDASIREAARRMADDGRGFTPIADHEKIVGIVTDRDIATRAVATGTNPERPVSDIATGNVLYCYEQDNVFDVLQNMQDKMVQRLLVLNNDKNKDLSGVVSLSDIAQQARNDEYYRRVANACRHYH